MDAVEPAYIEEFFATEDALRAEKAAARGKWHRLIPIAAALAGMLMLGGVFLLPALRKGPSPDLPPVGSESDLPSVGTESDLPSVGSESDLPSVDITILTPEMLNSGMLSGTPFKEVGDPNAGQEASSNEMVPPHFPVDAKALNLTARATEVLPHIYETLPAYGSVRTKQYRVIKMTVLDPLDSGMSGDFYYAMPISDYVDVLGYDALLISVKPSQNNLYRDLSTGELTTFSAIFSDIWDMPQYWHMLPFSDGVFDESIFESYEGTDFDEWLFHYRNYTGGSTDQLDPTVDRKTDWEKYLLVYHGSTYEEAISTYKTLRAEYLAPFADGSHCLKLETGFTSPEALAAMAYVRHPENGSFNYTMSDGYFYAQRYINGCPTNETISVSNVSGTEVVQHGNRFEESDMEHLPDVAGFVESLDLAALTPPHLDMSLVREQAYCSAAGWYEKTADGVECFVKIYWIYWSDDHMLGVLLDDAYIHLTPDGATFLSREEMRALIGDSSYLSRFPYNDILYVPDYY